MEDTNCYHWCHVFDSMAASTFLVFWRNDIII